MKNDSEIEKLIKDLENKNKKIRAKAIEELTALGKPVVPFLISNLLEKKDKKVKSHSAAILGKIGIIAAKESVPALLKATDDEDKEIRSSAIQALSEIGYKSKEVVDVIVKALEDESWSIKVGAEKALADLKIKDKRAIPILIQNLQDDNFKIRGNAAYALGKLGVKKAVGALIKILEKENENEKVRINALASLAHLKVRSKELIPLLLKLFEKEKSVDIRKNAVLILANIASKDTVFVLLKGLKDPSWEIRYNCIIALGRMGEDAQAAVPGIMNALRDEHSEVRKIAAVALPKIEGKEKISRFLLRVYNKLLHIIFAPILFVIMFINEILNYLKLSQPKQKTNRYGNLKQKIKTLKTHFLMGSLKSGSIEQRIFLIKQLGKTGSSGLPVLIELLSHQDTNVRRQAVYEIEHLGKQAKMAIPALLKAMEQREHWFKNVVVKALQKIGSARFEEIEGLIECLKLKDDEIRKLAKKELLNIGTETIPYVVAAMGEYNTEMIDVLVDLGNQAVPSLVNSLVNKNLDTLCRVKIVKRLEKMGEARNELIDAFIKIIDEKDDELLEIAINGLGTIQAIKALPVLIKHLKDENPLVREHVAESVGKFGYDAHLAVPVLVEIMADRNVEVAKAASLALQKIGLSSDLDVFTLVKILKFGLSSEDKKLIVASITALELQGAQDSIPLLIEACGVHDSSIRQKAEDALIKIGNQAVPFIIKAMLNENNLIKNASSKVFDALRFEDKTSVLVDALKDEDELLQRGAIYKLGEIKTKNNIAIMLLINRLGDRDILVKEALVKIGFHAVYLLIDHLDRDFHFNINQAISDILIQIGGEKLMTGIKSLSRSQAEKLFEKIGYKRVIDFGSKLRILRETAELLEIGTAVVPVLVRALGTEDELVRRQIISILLEIDEIESISDDLIYALKYFSGDVNIKKAIIVILGKKPQDNIIINSLVELIKDQHAEVRALAVETIADFSSIPKKVVFELVPALNDRDANIRASAAYALGKQKDISKNVVDALINTLKVEKEIYVMSMLISTLGDIRAESAISFLVDFLKNSEREIVDAAVDALVNIGKDGVPYLLKNLETGNGKVDIKGEVARVLINIGVPAIGVLVKNSGKNLKTKRLVAELLGKIGFVSDDQVMTLVKYLDDKDIKLRKIALQGLLDISSDNDDEFMPVLVKSLRNENWEIRRSAIELIGKIGDLDEEMILRVINLLADRHEEVRFVAMETLSVLRIEDLSILNRALWDKDWRVREGMVKVVGKMASNKREEYLILAIVDLLIPVLGDKESRVVGVCLETMVNMGSLVVPVLIENLVHRNDRIRLNIIKLFGKMGRVAEPASGALFELVENQNMGIGKASIEALGKIGSESAIARLKKIKVQSGEFKKLVQKTIKELQENR